MKIRAMQLEDMEEVVGMMRVFYDSPAVIHAAPDEILRQDVKDCVGECPYIEGYIFEEDGKILGYSMVAKSYSTEYGGMCVWVEDLYMKEEARGLGIGTAFFRFLDEKYKDQAVRFRLEVEEDNERAVAVYKKAGYQPLPYMQMTKEQEACDLTKGNERKTGTAARQWCCPGFAFRHRRAILRAQALYLISAEISLNFGCIEVSISSKRIAS